MTSVFVPCKHAMSKRAASKFGDLNILLDQSNPNRPTSRLALEPDRILKRFSKPLNTYEPVGDMILLDGQLIYNAVATSMLSCSFNTINFLIWIHKNQIYRKRTLSLKGVRSSRKLNLLRGPDGKTIVFAMNDAHIMDKADKFGALKIVKGTQKEPTDPQKLFDELSPELKRSNPDDFLLLTGDKLSNSIASSILARRHGVVNYLIYHFKLKTYIPRTVEFSKERIRRVIR